MSEAQETAVDSSLKKRGRPAKGAHSAPSSPVASRKHPRRETICSILAKKPAKKFDMRSILDKHPSAKISGPKYSVAVPSDALDDLPGDDAPDDIPDEQVEPVSKCSLALIIDLI
jgi:hypothetical protein